MSAVYILGEFIYEWMQSDPVDFLSISTVCALLECIIQLSLMLKDFCAVWDILVTQTVQCKGDQLGDLLQDWFLDPRRQGQFILSLLLGELYLEILTLLVSVHQSVCPAGDLGNHGQATLFPAAWQ